MSFSSVPTDILNIIYGFTGPQHFESIKGTNKENRKEIKSAEKNFNCIDITKHLKQYNLVIKVENILQPYIALNARDITLRIEYIINEYYHVIIKVLFMEIENQINQMNLPPEELLEIQNLINHSKVNINDMDLIILAEIKKAFEISPHLIGVREMVKLSKIYDLLIPSLNLRRIIEPILDLTIKTIENQLTHKILSEIILFNCLNIEETTLDLLLSYSGYMSYCLKVEMYLPLSATKSQLIIVPEIINQLYTVLEKEYKKNHLGVNLPLELKYIYLNLIVTFHIEDLIYKWYHEPCAINEIVVMYKKYMSLNKWKKLTRDEFITNWKTKGLTRIHLIKLYEKEKINFIFTRFISNYPKKIKILEKEIEKLKERNLKILYVNPHDTNLQKENKEILFKIFDSYDPEKINPPEFKKYVELASNLMIMYYRNINIEPMKSLDETYALKFWYKNVLQLLDFLTEKTSVNSDFIKYLSKKIIGHSELNSAQISIMSDAFINSELIEGKDFTQSGLRKSYLIVYWPKLKSQSGIYSLLSSISN